MSDLNHPTAADRERDIFLGALEHLAGPDRSAYLREACGADSALRAAVEALLANHKPDAFLERPVLQTPARGPKGTLLVSTRTVETGDRIGRYKLLQDIGEGACGTVYMAEQEEPVRRRVALKIIKLGMDSKAVIARFEAERQALALMDHANIAKVFDAGATETGRPYFVMELVRGIRITDYCDQNQLSTRERLELFAKVCHAIQHAHQKGIIHRDIKPSNILVTLHDGVPVPKVIDFGIAKAIEQRLTDKTVFTQFQAFVGTPAYTSPEQAEMSGLDIDTRADIYSLGVLLYELLTGQTPFDPQHLHRLGLDELRRVIREEEPLRPSTRLSTLGVAEATALTRARQSQLPTIVQTVRGDLDWIVMKCLEKDRTRRYPTANALATDLQRYLDNEPVSARPPSTAYRVGKFIRRNRVVVTATGAIALILITALVLSSWMAVRALHAEHEQSRLRGTAEASEKNESRERVRAERERIDALRRAYTSDMNLVQQALAAKNYGRVIDLLSRHRPNPQTVAANELRTAGQLGLKPNPDFRQWEWRYFWNQSRSEASFALPRQTNSISEVVLSPNGRLLATSDRSGTVKLWDVAARSEVAVIRQAGAGPIGFGQAALAFSHDGARLALAANHGPRRSAPVKIWTVATRQFTGELPVDGFVELLAFSPDDSKLLTFGRVPTKDPRPGGGFAQEAKIGTWDLQTQQSLTQVQVPSLERGPGPRQAAVFSPDAQLLALTQAGHIRVLDVQSGRELSNSDKVEADIASLAFSPSGQMLAAGPSVTGTNTVITILDTHTGQISGELKGHVSWIPALVFTPDGKRLISAGADQTIGIWDVEHFQEVASLHGHGSEINAVAVASDGNTVVSGCKDGTLLGWDLQHVSHILPYETLPGRVASVEFFPDNRTMLSVNADGTVSLWTLDLLQTAERLDSLGHNVNRLLLSPDGSRLYASGGRDGIKVLDWATRLVITNLFPSAEGVGWAGGGGPGGPGGPGGFHGPPNSVTPIALVDQGRSLVTAASGTIRLTDTTSWQTTAEWKFNETGFFPQLLVTAKERLLVAASQWSGGVEFRNLLTGEAEGSLPAQTWGVSGLAFSPDGTLLATSSVDGTVNLWDPVQKKLLDVLRGHLLGVHAVAFSPDGERLATISHGNEAVKLWDVTTRHEVATLAGQGALFNSVKFSPDGRFLIAINMQRHAYVWRAPSRDEIAAIERP